MGKAQGQRQWWWLFEKIFFYCQRCTHLGPSKFPSIASILVPSSQFFYAWPIFPKFPSAIDIWVERLISTQVRKKLTLVINHPFNRLIVDFEINCSKCTLMVHDK
jgi:hypothetical protein